MRFLDRISRINRSRYCQVVRALSILLNFELSLCSPGLCLEKTLDSGPKAPPE